MTQLPEPSFEFTSAMSLRTLAWNANTVGLTATSARRQRVEDIGLQWQVMSSEGDFSELTTSSNYPGPSASLKLNRVNELAGLMGSAGEQLCLAWTAEQDAQRWRHGGEDATRAMQERMAIRAYSELAAHFCLGAANNLANIVLRVMLLDERLTPVLGKEYARFAPAVYKVSSDDPKDWLFFSERLLNALERTAAAATSDRCLGLHASNTTRSRCSKLVRTLAELHADARFVALSGRRGMDYHRHRPQSLSTSSPRGGAWVVDPGIRTLGVGGLRPDPHHNEKDVHRIAASGLEAVATAMKRLRPLIVLAAASMGYVLICHDV